MLDPERRPTSVRVRANMKEIQSPCSTGGGPVRSRFGQEGWVDRRGRVVRYNLAYVTHLIYAGDNVCSAQTDCCLYSYGRPSRIEPESDFKNVTRTCFSWALRRSGRISGSMCGFWRPPPS